MITLKMDSVTHVLSGAAAASFGIRQKLGKSGVLMFIIAASAPDLDFLLNIFFKTVYVRFHRGFTHSLLLMPFFALILAFTFRIFSRADFRLLYLIAFAGLLMHITMDVLNSYGTPILLPLSHRQFGLNFDIIIDAYFFAPLLLAWLAAILVPEKQVPAAAAAFAIALCATGFRFIQHERALVMLGKAARTKTALSALPSAPKTIYDPFVWTGVEKESGGSRAYSINTRTGKTLYNGFFPYPEEELKKYTRLSGYLRDFLAWSRYPYASIEKTAGGRTTVRAGDLRFAADKTRCMLSAEFNNGKLVSQTFSFR